MEKNTHLPFHRPTQSRQGKFMYENPWCQNSVALSLSYHDRGRDLETPPSKILVTEKIPNRPTRPNPFRRNFYKSFFFIIKKNIYFFKKRVGRVGLMGRCLEFVWKKNTHLPFHRPTQTFEVPVLLALSPTHPTQPLSKKLFHN